MVLPRKRSGLCPWMGRRFLAETWIRLGSSGRVLRSSVRLFVMCLALEILHRGIHRARHFFLVPSNLKFRFLLECVPGCYVKR